MLDAELDFHKKMSSGEDTTDLKRKLGQLQVEVMHRHAHTHVCTVDNHRPIKRSEDKSLETLHKQSDRP